MEQTPQIPLDPRHIPPHNLEAERSLLGALLLDNSAYHRVLDVGLEALDFYREAHGKIFEAIQDLAIKSEPMDLVTLTAVLKNRGSYEQIGGTAYLTSLFESAYSSAHAVYYAKIIKEKSILRRIIGTTNEIAEKAHDGVEDLEEFLDYAESSIFEVTESKVRKSFTDIKKVLMENMQTIQELSEKKTNVVGIPTGFNDLDEKTAGLHSGALIIIAGRPAMGKTSFVLNVAENAATLAKASVAIFSLEMSKEELGIRFLTSLAKVDASRLKVGRLVDRDWKALTKAAGILGETKIFIDDSPSLTVMEMRSRCRRLLSEHGLNLVIVDYLQLMKGSSKNTKGGDSREREISEISRNLKALAKELKVPIIALSQLNRGVESRTDKRPMLSDLRESGAIEQDADIVAFVYRDEVYNKDSEDKGVAELIIAKHRAGSVGTVRLAWIAECTSFGNLAPEYGAGAPGPSQHSHKPQSGGNDPFGGGGGPPPLKRGGGLDLPSF